MNLPRPQYTIQSYGRGNGDTFEPRKPEVPDGERGRWVLHKITPLEPGWVMCHWAFSDEWTVMEELRNARETLVAVHAMLRQLHPKESDHPGCAIVEGVIARTLVQLGTVRRFTLPQHLEKYVEDMEIEP